MSQSAIWVCMPCFNLVPKRFGAIQVHGGTSDPVWCPWCGDAMESAHDYLTPQEWYDVMETLDLDRSVMRA